MKTSISEPARDGRPAIAVVGTISEKSSVALDGVVDVAAPDAQTYWLRGDVHESVGDDRSIRKSSVIFASPRGLLPDGAYEYVNGDAS